MITLASLCRQRVLADLSGGGMMTALVGEEVSRQDNRARLNAILGTAPERNPFGHFLAQVRAQQGTPQPVVEVPIPELVWTVLESLELDRVEYSIVLEGGAHSVYEGDSRGVTAGLSESPLGRLVLHTHRKFHALPSTTDLQGLIARSQRRPSHQEFIYSRPVQTQEWVALRVSDHHLGGGATVQAEYSATLFSPEGGVSGFSLRYFTINFFASGMRVFETFPAGTALHRGDFHISQGQPEPLFWCQVIHGAG